MLLLPVSESASQPASACLLCPCDSPSQCGRGPAALLQVLCNSLTTTHKHTAGLLRKSTTSADLWCSSVDKNFHIFCLLPGVHKAMGAWCSNQHDEWTVCGSLSLSGQPEFTEQGCRQVFDVCAVVSHICIKTVKNMMWETGRDPLPLALTGYYISEVR